MTLQAKAVGSLFGILVASGATAAVINEYHFIKGCTDWQSPDSYTEQVKPPASTPDAQTDIIMPAGWTNTVSSAEDYAYLSSIRAIQLPKNGGILCRVDSGTQDLGCAVYTIQDLYWEPGTLVKEGEGVLRLTAQDKEVSKAYSYHSDYKCDHHVKEGRVVLYPNETRSADRELCCVTIDAGATLELAAGGNRWFTRELSGEGTLYANVATKTLYNISCSQGGGMRTFSGKLTGNMGLGVSGAMNLTGEDNDFVGLFVPTMSATEKKYLGIAKFGRKGGPGSIGTETYYNAGANGSASERFMYLGTGGDRPNHRTFVYGMDKTPFTLHGGPNGGWDCSEWDLPNYSEVHGRFALEGDDGSAANKFSVKCVSGPKLAGTTTGIYKRGGGTWTMAAIPEDASRTDYIGLISVEGGVLEPENVDNVGFASSLGFGLNTCYDWDTNTSKMVEVPYGIRLGGAGDSPAVLSIGSKHSVPVYDRPIALAKGEGHLRNSTADQPVMWKGVSAVEAGGSKFYLDGTCTATSTVAGVSNGSGTVSVIKDGPGTWCLTGEQTFTGSLEAKAGTLILKKHDYSAYTWYRWVIRDFQGNATTVALDQLAVYDAAGKRLGKGATFNKYAAALQPGECAWGFKHEVEGMYEDIGTMTNRGHRADGLFSGSTPMWKDKAQGGKDVYNSCQMAMPFTPSPTQPHTHFTVLQRLPEGANEAAYLDICNAYSGPAAVWQSSDSVKNFALEASVDGFTWNQIYEDTDAPLSPTAAQHQWLSDNAAGWGTCGRDLTSDGAGGFTNGFVIPAAKRRPSGTAPAFLTGITAFKVTAGAKVVGEGGVTLPENIAMTIDASGTGTASVTGVVFPENGTLDVTGVDKDVTELPVTFSDASYANLTRWTLTSGGKRWNRTLVAKDGKLYVNKNGLTVILR